METSKRVLLCIGIVLLVTFAMVLLERNVIRTMVPSLTMNSGKASDKIIQPFWNAYDLTLWSTLVGKKIRPGIFDDCNLLFQTTRRDQLLPAVLNKSYSVYKKHKDNLMKSLKVPDEGTSLSYPEESLVYWNIAHLYPGIKTVCETGFNFGESSLLFLLALPTIHVYSFDIGKHKYTKPMATHLDSLFPNRFNITWGDSLETLPLFVKLNPDLQCDLIFIDGLHKYHGALSDFDNFAKIAHTGSIVILDNYPDYRLDFMKGIGGMWEDKRRTGELNEVFKCTYGRKRNQGFSVGVLIKIS